MILGKDLIVSMNGTPVAAAKSCTLSVSQDFIQACSPTQGRVMTKIPATYDWSISVNGLIGNARNATDLVDLLANRERVLITFTYADNPLWQCAGYAYVKSCETGGSVGNISTFSAAFESTGPLYTYHVSYSVAAFTEGEGKEFSISDGKPVYTNDQNYNIYGRGIIIPKTSLVYINHAENSFVLYEASLATVKTAISSGTTGTLESSIVTAAEEGSYTAILQPGTYTILESVYHTGQSSVTLNLWREA